jgi:WD40 repeat protein
MAPTCEHFHCKRKRACRGHADDVIDVSWSPDGSGLVSASIENTVILWDVAKGKRKVRTAITLEPASVASVLPLARHCRSLTAT